jgi:serine/threonine protein kinase
MMDRWQEISRVFQEALARPADARTAFVAASCGDDTELRREVESLLAHAQSEPDGTFADMPTLGASAGEIAAALRIKTPGDRLAHYRIVSKLGAGGMGEVYRARDEQLDRDVAIKVLPPTSFDNPTARVRLVREARAAAALNHPHICTVHEVGEANGETYIAMELVEGETLSARLAAGALPIDLVLKYALQLADALGLSDHRIATRADTTRNDCGHARLHGAGAAARTVGRFRKRRVGARRRVV